MLRFLKSLRCFSRVKLSGETGQPSNLKGCANVFQRHLDTGTKKDCTRSTRDVSVEPKWGEMMEMMVMMLMSCQFTGDEAKTDRTSARHRPIVNHRPSPLGHGAFHLQTLKHGHGNKH